MIDGITFSITMPKDFNEEELGFSSGPVGSTDDSNVHYEVGGNIITGYFDGTLFPGEALTVRVELPEGYFIGAGYEYDASFLWFFLIPLLCLIISIVLWFVFGKNDHVVETVEFYPPANMNSIDVAYAYKGEVTDKDIVSLLVYLASKGYLKIVETEEKKFLIKKKNFKLIKLKEYDGNNAHEKNFFNSLFRARLQQPSFFSIHPAMVKKIQKNSDKVAEVDISALKNRFYRTIGKISKAYNNKDRKYRYFMKNSFYMAIVVQVLMIITFVFCHDISRNGDWYYFFIVIRKR